VIHRKRHVGGWVRAVVGHSNGEVLEVEGPIRGLVADNINDQVNRCSVGRLDAGEHQTEKDNESKEEER
jgi:hypothetical protein